MSTGIDVAACVSGASAVTVTASGSAVGCTASDGTAGTVSVLHLALVDSTNDVPDFDYTQATAIWMGAFWSIIFLYCVAKGAGAIVNFIRDL